VTRQIECEGAPRDLGLAQGRACRIDLERSAARRSIVEKLEDLLPGGSASRRLRDIKRHYPHQSESMAGLSVGAGVSETWLVRQLNADGDPAPMAATIQEHALLARGFQGDTVVRRSRPEGLFRSVELTRPWLTSSLIGVNERGLGVAVSCGAGTAVEAPAILLAQDCLERFENTEAAVEWCLNRPATGPATVFLLDAAGDAAGVEILEPECRVSRPSEGVLVVGGRSDAAELAKLLRDARPSGACALASLVAAERSAAIDPAGPELVVAGERFSP
jgi:hypothetical protein